MALNEYRTPRLEIHSATRLGVSANGIASWKLNTSEGPWTTETNAHINNEIERLSSVDAGSDRLIGYPGRQVVLVHTRGKKVVAIEFAGKQYR
jgi:hypothetical protein